MKIKLARWYVVLAVRVPGRNDPLCVGLGLPGYESKARDAAMTLAADLVTS